MTINPTHLIFKANPVDRPATTRIVIHHTAGPADQSVESIHNYHKRERGWLGIGYNVIQTEDGQWHAGRGLDKQGAHATGYNDTSIGISLIGNFEATDLPDHRWDSLVRMCRYLMDRYGLVSEDVVGHGELPGASTACPGVDMDALRRELKNQKPDVLYRVVVDGKQVGAWKMGEYVAASVRLALEQKPQKILIEKTG